MTTKVSEPAKGESQRDIELQEQKHDLFWHREIKGPGFSTIFIAPPRRKRNHEG